MYAVDAISEGEQYGTEDFKTEEEAQKVYDMLVEFFRNTKEHQYQDQENTVRLIRNGEVLHSTTIKNRLILDRF